MKAISFNTDMVRALLDGRKTQTRRVIKNDKRTPDNVGRPKLNKMVKFLNGKPFFGAGFYKDDDVFAYNGETIIDGEYFKSLYKPQDILWVRETWRPLSATTSFWEFGESVEVEDGCEFQYKADSAITWRDGFLPKENEFYSTEIIHSNKWRSSSAMPKEASRIFLRVTDVRVERLQDITEQDAIAEGFAGVECEHSNGLPCTDCYNSGWIEPPQVDFIYVWNSTIKKSNMGKCGWDANPWVWVYEFEVCDKSEVC